MSYLTYVERYKIYTSFGLPPLTSLGASKDRRAYRRPQSGSYFELESTTQGLLLPRLTTAQRDSIPIHENTEG